MGRKLLIVALVMALAVGWLYRDQIFPPREIPYQKPDEIPMVTPVIPLEAAELRRQELLAGLAACPAHGAPAALPWYPLFQIGTEKLFPLENLLANDPTLFFEMALRRYDQEIHGYKLIFNKRERMAGKMKDAEKVEVHFREQPFSVHMNWLVKGGSAASKVLYVEGENDNQMRCRPNGLVGFLLVSRKLDSPDSKGSGRYTIDQFGFKRSTQRTLGSMRDAQARGALFIKYAGMVKLKEVGDRPCYKFIRSPYSPPEEEGVNELTLYFDVENWLQVGSVLRNSKGELLAEYYFRDVQLNPRFDNKQFKDSSL